MPHALCSFLHHRHRFSVTTGRPAAKGELRRSRAEMGSTGGVGAGAFLQGTQGAVQSYKPLPGLTPL